jgi:phospholipid/cholesterol/gamma-HCH transport system substrate-binding protein
MEESQASVLSEEFKVGLMVVAAGLTFMVAILFVNNFHFSASGYVARARFSFLGDLKSNAPVEYAGGIKVGAVEDIRIVDGQPEVELRITEPNFQLRKDSQVAIYSAGLLGSRYVQISADLGTGEPLGHGDVLIGVDANNLDKTFSQLGDVLETFEHLMGDPKAKENFLKTFENMNKTTENLLALSETSRQKVERILDSLQDSSGKADKIVNSVQSVARSLDTLTTTLDKKQIQDSIKNLNSALKTMNQLAQNIQNGQGTIGLLVSDQKTADDIRDMVEDLKAHPWRLLWKK